MEKRLFVIRWLFKNIKPYWGMLMLITLFSSISSVCSVGIAVVSKNLVDYAIAKQTEVAIEQGVQFVLLIILLLLLNAAISILSVKVSVTMNNNMFIETIRKLSFSDWIALIEYHSDDILTRLTSDVNIVVNGITSVIPGLIALGIQLLTAFITLFSIDRTLGILAFMLGPFTLLIYRLFSKKLREMHLKTQELEANRRVTTHESLQNMLVVRAFAIENKISEKIQAIQKEQYNIIMSRSRLSVITNSSFSIGYWAGYFLAFGWGAMRLAQGAVTFGSLTAFLQLVGQIQSPFIGLARSVPQLIATEASASRIIELEQIPADNMDTEKLSWAEAGISFENTTFAYKRDGNSIIKDANLDISPGEIIGIVGTSGEGKTTIIRLLLALIRPTEGKLYFTNGNERIEATAACRNMISYVPQGNTLFSGTIAENLRIANQEVSDMEIETALKQADAWEFIQEIPEGIDTKIGEKATLLSEGQAQRITIARALLKKSAILLLDEATSALDAKTELNILQAINDLRPRRTCVLITHRPSALKICDRILHLENGVLQEKSLYDDIGEMGLSYNH